VRVAAVEVVLLVHPVRAALVVVVLVAQMLEPLVRLTQVVEAEAVALVVAQETEVLAALVLSLSEYLTTYPQHSLVALHRVCPHPVGSTSTL
jgi:hypothetical protein